MLIMGCIGDAAAASLIMVLTCVSSEKERQRFESTRHPSFGQRIFWQAAKDFVSLESTTWLSEQAFGGTIDEW